MLSRFSCVSLCNPVDRSPTGFSVHGILQVRILEWVAISSSKGSSWPRNQTHVSYVSCIGFSFSSVTQSYSTLCNPMYCSTPGLPVHHQLPELTQTHVHWVGDTIHHLILCCPLLLPPSIFPSIRVSSNESVLLIRWPKFWSFSFSISPSNEYSGLISFRMDLLDLFAVQGTLKSLLQHHSSKAPILWHSAFFIVQLSHPYMITGKTIALTRQTFVVKVMTTFQYAVWICHNYSSKE